MAFEERIIEFGEGDFGEVSFNETTDDNEQRLRELLNERAINVSDDEVDAIITTLHVMADRIDVDGYNSFRERYVSTASLVGLRNLQRPFGLQKKDDETIDEYRTRIQGAYAAAASQGTYDQVATLALNLMDASSDEIALKTPPDIAPPNTVIIQTDPAVIDQLSLSTQTIEDFLEQAVPAGHAVQIEQRGTFEFDGPDYTPPSGTGFNEGTFGSVIED